ncbi:MAG: twin-arginine translocation signal domain-containing protein [Nitrospiraceae bacterium]|nr:twin-arginine translocation signal domain-containing protein [Nitrospiraceae bacterium]
MTRFTISRRGFLAGASAAGLATGLAGARQHNGDEESTVTERTIDIPAHYYQHYDADFTREVPEEGFGGWHKEALSFSRDHTAVVAMHAWDAGTREEFPGWWNVVPYIPRANAICEDVFPRLLAAVRASDFPLFHVVGGGDYYKDLPGYKRAVELAGPPPPKPPRVESDPVRDGLYAFRQEHAYTGLHNADDIKRGFARLDFAPNSAPVGDEGVAENGPQLFALCQERGINHLIYAGFALNWCLLLSPGGMAEMCHQYGVMCSTIRQATTAVENGETARQELCKQIALWRVSLAFGFVFDVDDLVGALDSKA